MPGAIESHLALLEREAGGPANGAVPDDPERLGELIALHVALYEVLERRLGPGGLTEAHRPQVPVFRRWLAAARGFAAAARELGAAGRAVEGADELSRASNRAKLIAEDFDEVVRLNARLAHGEPGTYRPLAGVVDGLRAEPQPPR